MSVESYISPSADRGDESSIEGRGLFAWEPIPAGHVVAIKGGHIVDADALEQLPAPLANSEIQIAPGLFLVACEHQEYERVMLFLNHSCEPNVGLRGNVVFVAMRDVEAGEELTTDYALFDDADAEMACNCRTVSCRGTITGHDWRRPELQERYRGYFSTYLEDAIAALQTSGVTA